MSKAMTVEELARNMSNFALTMYDTRGWTQDFIHQMSMVLEGLVYDQLQTGMIDANKLKFRMIIGFNKQFGISPQASRGELPWMFWVAACTSGDDEFALRLLMDGFNPKVRRPGYHSARNYIQKNRHNLPKTWAYFCKLDLSNKAAKVRKHSWTSNTYTERSM